METHNCEHHHILQDLLNGRVSCVEFSGGNVYVDAPRRGRIYLPGSFNPLHDGHKELLQVGTGWVVVVWVRGWRWSAPGLGCGWDVCVGGGTGAECSRR